MTLQQLRYFVETARQGSFAGAADALYLAQPSVADQVRRLESELGVQLFSRVSRRLKLTDAGRALQQHAEAILASVETARSAVVSSNELSGGTATLGMTNYAFQPMARDVVATFVGLHPETAVKVIGNNSVQVADLIRDGELEAGLLTLPVDLTGLEAEIIMQDEVFFAACEKDIPDEPLTIEVLAKTRLILPDASYGWSSPTRRQLAERALAAGIQLQPVIEVEGNEAPIELAALGHGGTLVREMTRHDPRFPPELRTVPMSPPLLDALVIVTRAGWPLSPATREILRIAREHLATLNARGLIQRPVAAAGS
jgi:DNA-binding transcriptional LysR family regulator